MLGLLVDLQDRYVITSNRESGFGRYDVMIEPREPEKNDAYILEFKVHDADDEQSLKDTVTAALRQIEEKQYAAGLIGRGIKEEHIQTQYGIPLDQSFNCAQYRPIGYDHQPAMHDDNQDRSQSHHRSPIPAEQLQGVNLPFLLHVCFLISSISIPDNAAGASKQIIHIAWYYIIQAKK